MLPLHNKGHRGEFSGIGRVLRVARGVSRLSGKGNEESEIKDREK